MEEQDAPPQVELEFTSVNIVVPLFTFGIDDGGMPAASFNTNALSQMRGISEVERMIALEVLEQTFATFVSMLCGGKRH